MYLGSLCFLLSLIWAVIYVFYYLLLHIQSRSLLPVPFSSGRRRIWDNTSTQLILNNLHLRVQTTTWNFQHDALSSRLASRRPSHARTFLSYFYNAGCIFGVVGLVGAIGLLFWNCGKMGSLLLENIFPESLHHQTSNPTIIPVKRGLEAVSLLPAKDGGYGSPKSYLKPIVSPLSLVPHVAQISCSYDTIHTKQA